MGSFYASRAFQPLVAGGTIGNYSRHWNPDGDLAAEYIRLVCNTDLKSRRAHMRYAG